MSGRSSGVRNAVGDLSHLRTSRLSLTAWRRQAWSALEYQLPWAEGQDHRLLCSPGSRESHAPGRGRLAKTPALFARPGGVKQGAELAACPRGGYAMKAW